LSFLGADKGTQIFRREEKLSAEALALRELKSVQEQLQALELAIEQMAKRTS
jgi:hypothetical protein